LRLIHCYFIYNEYSVKPTLSLVTGFDGWFANGTHVVAGTQTQADPQVGWHLCLRYGFSE
jgi:hypothetical protein